MRVESGAERAKRFSPRFSFVQFYFVSKIVTNGNESDERIRRGRWMLRTKLTFDVQFALIISHLKWRKECFDGNFLLRFDQIFRLIQAKRNSAVLLFDTVGSRIGNQIPFVDADG